MTMVNGFTNIIYGQTNATQTNSSNATNLVNTQDIPLETSVLEISKWLIKCLAKEIL